MFLEVPTSSPCKPPQDEPNFNVSGAVSSKGLVVPLRRCHKGRTKIQLGFPAFFTVFIRKAKSSGKLEQC